MHKNSRNWTQNLYDDLPTYFDLDQLVIQPCQIVTYKHIIFFDRFSCRLTMGLESTIICIDNSEFMRNGDYLPTRLQAQQVKRADLNTQQRESNSFLILHK